MADPLNIVALAGATRERSFNKQLLRIAADAGRRAGAEVTTIDLRQFPMPLCDSDLQEREGFPENVRRLKALFIAADGLLIASPEYNASFSGVLKNAIDWISRSESGEPALAAFKGKAAAIMSASPGGLGGYRGLTQLRWVLTNMGVHVLPDQVTVPQADRAFDDDGSLKDPKKQASVEALAATLVDFLARLRR